MYRPGARALALQLRARELERAPRLRLHVDVDDGHLFAVSVTSDAPAVMNVAIDLLMAAGARSVTEVAALKDSWGAAHWFIDCADVLWVEQMSTDKLSPGPAVACELKLAGLMRPPYHFGDHAIAALQRELVRVRAPQPHPKPDANRRAEDLACAIDTLTLHRGGRSLADVFAPMDQERDEQEVTQ